VELNCFRCKKETVLAFRQVVLCSECATEICGTQLTDVQQPQLSIVKLFNRWLLTVCKSKVECDTVKSFCEYVQQQQAVR